MRTLDAQQSLAFPDGRAKIPKTLDPGFGRPLAPRHSRYSTTGADVSRPQFLVRLDQPPFDLLDIRMLWER